MTRKTFLSSLLASVAVFLPIVPVAAEGACLSDREINQAVANGQILPFNTISSRLSGKPLSFKVCDRGGQLYYEVTVDEGAQVHKVYLNAKTGQP
jgi:hypothetical protein